MAAPPCRLSQFKCCFPLVDAGLLPDVCALMFWPILSMALLAFIFGPRFLLKHSECGSVVCSRSLICLLSPGAIKALTGLRLFKANLCCDNLHIGPSPIGSLPWTQSRANYGRNRGCREGHGARSAPSHFTVHSVETTTSPPETIDDVGGAYMLAACDFKQQETYTKLTAARVLLTDVSVMGERLASNAS